MAIKKSVGLPVVNNNWVFEQEKDFIITVPFLICWSESEFAEFKNEQNQT
jgi:hypothetical protein